MRKRIVLVKPPETSRLNFGTFSLAVLAGAVRHIADITLVDATGLDRDEAAREVIAENPDIIGVTVMSEESVDPASCFVRSLKNSLKQTPRPPTIIAGGHGASMHPLPLLHSGAAAVVYGEGEKTMRQVIEEGIVPGAKGLVCQGKNGTVRGKPQEPVYPLDSLEKPARDLMPASENVFLMETSRGCPHSCRFCETTRFYGREWRPFSPGRIAEEVHELVEKHRAWVIHFTDDNFAADPERVLRICDELQKVSLPAVILASARADDLASRPVLLKEMSDARIRRITVGVETLDPLTAGKAGKPVSPSIYKEVFRKMREHDIFSVASFIVGLPGESPEIRKNSVALALDAAPDAAHFLPFLPLAGTPYANERKPGKADQRDIRDSGIFNTAFRNHPATIARLKKAVDRGGIRGLFAEKTLQKGHTGMNRQ